MAGEMKAEISRSFVLELADSISSHDSTFDTGYFLQILDNHWPDRELKDRISTVAKAMGEAFKSTYPDSLETLYLVAEGCSGLKALTFPEYVAQFGLNDWQASMRGLERFTSLCSSEFAVRAFIRADEGTMMQQLMDWAGSPDYHLRRLASEGCRPRLPWSQPFKRYITDPSPIIPVLEKLIEDDEDYVCRSVANNLNDISKDHPELALLLAEKWIVKNGKAPWIVKHGLRTLLKKGNTQAMRLFGFADPSSISVSGVTIGSGVARIGGSEDVVIHFDVESPEPEKIRVEYAVGYLKANGKHSEKVFQVGEYYLGKGQYSKKKRLSFKQMTTRKHYPGEHYVVAIINGKRKKHTEFIVKDSD